MIAAYSAGIKNPTLSLVNGASNSAAEIAATYNYYDSVNGVSMGGNVNGTTSKVYFKPNDVNFVKGSRDMVVNAYFEDPNGTTTITVDGKKINVSKVEPGKTYTFTSRNGGTVNTTTYTSSAKNGLVHATTAGEAVKENDKLQSGTVYYMEIDDGLVQAGVEANGAKFTIYFEVQSIINNKGLNDTVTVQKTSKTYTSFDFTRVSLFNLE